MMYCLKLGRSSSFKNLFAIGALMAVGFLLRAGYSLSLENRPYWDDGVDYHQLANNLASKHVYSLDGQTPFDYRPPGYPIFLAAIYAIFGPGVPAARLVQCLIGAATILLIYLIARGLFSERVAVAAALLLAVYPFHIYLPSTLFPETVLSFLLALIIYILILPPAAVRDRHLVGLGLLFGYGILLKPALAAFLPVALARTTAREKSPLPLRLRRLVLLLVPVLLLAGSWMWRNKQATGTLKIATNGGRNLWLGNNPAAGAATGNGLVPPEALRRRLEAAASDWERDRLYSDEALTYIRHAPLQTARLYAGKFLNFWRLYPKPSTGYKTPQTLSMLISILSYGPILVLALPGFVLAWKKARPETALILMLILSLNAFYALFFTTVRFRLPLDPFLIIFAAHAACHLPYRWRRRTAAAR